MAQPLCRPVSPQDDFFLSPTAPTAPRSTTRRSPKLNSGASTARAYNREDKIARAVATRYPGGGFGDKDAGRVWGTTARFRGELPTAKHRFLSEKPFGSDCIGGKMAALDRFPEESYVSQECETELQDIRVKKTQPKGYAFCTTSRDFDPSCVSAADRLWRAKLGPGQYKLELPQSSTQVKIGLAPRWGPGLGLLGHSDPAMGPGKYAIHQLPEQIPSFTLPVNEVGFVTLKSEIQDHIIQRNLVLQGQLSKQAAEQTISAASQTRNQRMAAATQARERLQHDAVARKREMCGRWERIKQQNAEAAADAMLEKQRSAKRAVVAGEAVALGSRTAQMAAAMLKARELRARHRMRVTAASRIQKSMRGYLAWKSTQLHCKMELFKEKISGLLFRRQFSQRIARRGQAAKIICEFASEVAYAEGLRSVCQRYRLSIIRVQRIVKDFLSVRQTQTEVTTRYFDRKARALEPAVEAQLAQSDVSFNSVSSAPPRVFGQPVAEPVKKPLPKWHELPLSFREQRVREDILRRRLHYGAAVKAHDEQTQLNAAWNLVHGVDEHAGLAAFRIFPSEEHVLGALVEWIKQWVLAQNQAAK